MELCATPRLPRAQRVIHITVSVLFVFYFSCLTCLNFNEILQNEWPEVAQALARENPFGHKKISRTKCNAILFIQVNCVLLL
jgi:hypothetical protein